MPDETNGINNAPVLGEVLWNGNGFCSFVVRVRQMKTVNTPLDRLP